MSFIRRPARKAMPKHTGISVTAVPRSGCRAISSSGTPAKMPAMTRSPVLRAPRRFSPKNIASISARVMRPNSDGWRLNGPMAIQRVALNCVEPWKRT